MPPKEVPKKDLIVEVGFVLIILILIYYLWSAILSYYFLSRFGSYVNLWHAIVAWLAQYVWPLIEVLAIIVSVFALWGIINTYRKLSKLRKEEAKIYGPMPEIEEAAPEKNEKWERIIAKINSPNASDWKLALIEADIMLDDMLRAEGYHGDTIGDMLKAIDRSEMLTLDAAWEAHKVRNLIAHSGSDYYLTEREAKRVLALYESVFKEFKII